MASMEGGEGNNVSEKSNQVQANKSEQTIVIALDASDQAESAVKWYLKSAHRPGNRVVFVHCIELPEMKLEQARSMHMSPGVLASMWKEAEAKTKILEDKMKALLKEKGLSGILRTSTGKPGEVICRIAEEEQAVMIVTGTRGMGKVRRTILGSVSDFLVNHAHCPVTVCRTDTPRPRLSSNTDAKKSRHTSGDSIKNLFSSLGRSSRTHSVASDTE
ncbi:hypothetical protein LSAT2_011877 [Lamellibrachia satsuma]|nr:hypothetical protein LSAT2_011877 [Lamellibrachia satsuma]